MQEQHRKAIQRNFLSLVERTDLDSMVSLLFEKGVFSDQMIEPYRDSNETPRERKRKLYRDITHRGPHAFHNLVEALRESGQWDLVRDLDPDSPLHFKPHRNINAKPTPVLPRSDENNFLSLSTEKSKAKTNLEMQKSHGTPPPPILNDNDVTDLSTDTPYFNVQKCTKFIEDDDNKGIKLYHTRGRQRGVLLVFSYTSFKHNIEKFRKGVDVDCKMLKYLFSEIGFTVVAYKDLTITETRKTLESLKSVLVGVESVFVVVSSHGYERRGSSDTDIRCSDGSLISFYDIIEYFNNRNLPALTHVPKVFIFQVCRGTSTEFVYGDSSGGGRRPGAMPMPREGVARDAGRSGGASPHSADKRLCADDSLTQDRLYSNILIAHSTLPGFASHRDLKAGSWYIQAVCKVFAEHAHDCHVDKLFTLVDLQLYEQFQIQTSSVDRWGFNKKLYLHPGLYE